MLLSRLPGRRAFTLIELLVVIAIIALLVAILLPALGEARRVARKGVCQSNYHQINIAYNNYGTDHKDLFPSFTWKAGVTYSQFSDIAVGVNDNLQAAAQATDIIRRLGGRTNPPFAVPANWIPHPRYSHLVLHDYLAQRIPERMVVCPDDTVLLGWQDQGRDNPPVISPTDPGQGVGEIERLPYSSSYTLVPAAVSPDRATPGASTLSPTPGSSRTINVPGSARLGQRRLTDVTFPSLKVSNFDSQSRHDRKIACSYAYPDVTQPVLFFDSSVRDVRTANANVGGNPVGLSPLPAPPAKPTPFNIVNQPYSFETPARPGPTALPGYYMWTRGGLTGVDVGGSDAQ